MTEPHDAASDDLRDVLSAYAATAPDLDPRDGLAARMTRYTRARRAAVAGVACLAAVVAGTGVAALSRDGGTRGLSVTDDGVPGESASPTTSPEGTPSSSAEPSPAAAPAPGPTHPGGPPRATASPEPVDTRPITKTAEGPDGLRVRVTLEPGAFPTATLGRLIIHAEDDDAQPRLGMLSWGDTRGGPYPIAADEVCTVPARPLPTLTPGPSKAPEPGELDHVVEHAYRTAGRYTISLHVFSAESCDEPDVPAEDATLSFEVTVTQGAVTSNGPAAPSADVWVREDDSDMLRRHVSAGVEDPDGHIGSMTIDWGDGTAATTVRNPDECEDGNGAHYPWDSWFGFPEIQHDYEDGGTYTVTVSGFSAGCDGADRQPFEKQVQVPVS